MIRQGDKVWIVPNAGGELHPAIIIHISKDEQRVVVMPGTGTGPRDIPHILMDPSRRVDMSLRLSKKTYFYQTSVCVRATSELTLLRQTSFAELRSPLRGAAALAFVSPGTSPGPHGAARRSALPRQVCRSSASLGDDIFLAKLSPSGGHVWSQRFGDANEQRGSAVAVDSMGNVVIAGYFFGSLKLGPTALVDVTPNAFDVFLAKFDALGNHLWSKSFAVSTPFVDMDNLAVDSAGNIYATGDFLGAIDFGGGSFPSDGTQMFVAKFAGSGKHLWSKRFGAGQDARGTSIAVDAAGNLVVTAVFTGTVDFGGGPLVSAGMGEGVILKLDAGGSYLWGKQFGSGVDQYSQHGVPYDPTSVLLVGNFGGALLNFGGGKLSSVGMGDVFLARLLTP